MNNNIVSCLKECQDYNFLYEELTDEELQYAEILISRHKEGFCRCSGNGHCLIGDYLSKVVTPDVLVKYVRRKFKDVSDGGKTICPCCGRPVFLSPQVNGFHSAVICPCGQWYGIDGNPLNILE